MMHGREKSDSAIVAGKPTNKAVSTAAEPVERRAVAKGNASQQSTRRTQSRVSVSQALERIRQAVTKNALPSHTQGGSRMPELGPYGSVRGARGNSRPYRERHLLRPSSSEFGPINGRYRTRLRLKPLPRRLVPTITMRPRHDHSCGPDRFISCSARKTLP